MEKEDNVYINGNDERSQSLLINNYNNYLQESDNKLNSKCSDFTQNNNSSSLKDVEKVFSQNNSTNETSENEEDDDQGRFYINS